jgi:hypothetical protein
MDYAQISEQYLSVREVRLATLVRRAALRLRDIEDFVGLEDRMNQGALGADWLRSFHLSNDAYMKLLHKVLKAAVKVGEPHAQAKLQHYVEELGTQGPAVFLTPWDLTLAYLDEHVGAFSEVAEFYGVRASSRGATA